MNPPANVVCPLAALLAAHIPAPAPQFPVAEPGGEPPRLLWTLDKAAERVSISRTKLYGLMRDDQLPSVLMGGRRYVAEQDLVAFVEKLRAGWQPWG
ncbi:helix-turn-helix domain-containing protein [Modestobacter sp. Leaf380]|uniref:helix-turn-helix domain-containing protein n=1 Tax=Modestobacter sp. Leaf380 TaxID=1736356 RepID=UPI0012F95F21|nr:helix-turn-helix domain-containing protein [Modestobacter sp. Leaf380]